MEDGCAVFPQEIPHQLSLVEVLISSESGVKHWVPPKILKPLGFTCMVQGDIPAPLQRETAGDPHTGTPQTLHTLGQRHGPALASDAWERQSNFYSRTNTLATTLIKRATPVRGVIKPLH